MRSPRELLTGVGLDPRRVGRLRWAKKVQVLRAHGEPVLRNLGYVISDPEIDNFTYELGNEGELCDWIATSLPCDRGRAAELLVEARSNPALYERLRLATSGRFSAKSEPPLGRRLGWYVIVRLVQPTRVIETGIHDGLGSLVLLAALDRNAEDGVEGELVSFDVDRTSGWMVGDHPRWSRRIESTTTGLETALREAPTQIFLHDSLHTYEHEHFELSTAARFLDRAGVLLSDNSHATSALSDVCERDGLRYEYFAERPRAHFYRGGGIGLGHWAD